MDDEENDMEMNALKWQDEKDNEVAEIDIGLEETEKQRREECANLILGNLPN